MPYFQCSRRPRRTTALAFDGDCLHAAVIASSRWRRFSASLRFPRFTFTPISLRLDSHCFSIRFDVHSAYVLFIDISFSTFISDDLVAVGAYHYHTYFIIWISIIFLADGQELSLIRNSQEARRVLRERSSGDGREKCFYAPPPRPAR